MQPAALWWLRTASIVVPVCCPAVARPSRPCTVVALAASPPDGRATDITPTLHSKVLMCARAEAQRNQHSTDVPHDNTWDHCVPTLNRSTASSHAHCMQRPADGTEWCSMLPI